MSIFKFSTERQNLLSFSEYCTYLYLIRFNHLLIRMNGPNNIKICGLMTEKVKRTDVKFCHFPRISINLNL